MYMVESSLNPEQLDILTQYIRQVDRYQNSGLFGQAIVEVSKTFRINPIPQIEMLLRKIQSETYLIAAPIELQPDFDARLPYDPQRIFANYVWIELNGILQAEKKLEQYHRTSEQNIELLPDTGLLVSKPNTPLGFELNARNN